MTQPAPRELVNSPNIIAIESVRFLSVMVVSFEEEGQLSKEGYKTDGESVMSLKKKGKAVKGVQHYVKARG